MPYIPKDTRLDLKYRPPYSPGELSFAITRFIQDYLMDDKYSYEQFAVIVGALELTKLEFVRRLVNPYEDEKIRENGDVF